MSSEHKAPLAAFLVVSIACVVVLINALRSDALSTLMAAAPLPVIAGELLLPDDESDTAPAGDDDRDPVEYAVPAPSAGQADTTDESGERASADSAGDRGERRDRSGDRDDREQGQVAEDGTGQTQVTLTTHAPAAEEPAPAESDAPGRSGERSHGHGTGHDARGGAAHQPGPAAGRGDARGDRSGKGPATAKSDGPKQSWSGKRWGGPAKQSAPTSTPTRGTRAGRHGQSIARSGEWPAEPSSSATHAWSAPVDDAVQPESKHSHGDWSRASSTDADRSSGSGSEHTGH